jgi:hypothetical protein
MDIHLLWGSCPHRLAAMSHQPPTLLTSASGLSGLSLWSSLYSLGMDHMENTASISSSIVGWCSYWRRLYGKHRYQWYFHWWHGMAWHVPLLRHCLLCHCLTRGMFAELFSSSGFLCWLHNPGFQQMCHDALCIQPLFPVLSPLLWRLFLFFLSPSILSSSFYFILLSPPYSTFSPITCLPATLEISFFFFFF